MKNIGYSTIRGLSGSIIRQGPIGATGVTGNSAVISITGPTGENSNYISEILIDETGFLTFKLSDGDYSGVGIIKGSTGIYRGVTAISVGSGIPILKGVSSGTTLEFYNFKADGLINITTDSDGSLKFSINPNTTAGGISSGYIDNTLVFAESKEYITSTYLVPEGTTSGSRVGSSSYVYINFAGKTGGRSIVADITESLLTVGPISRGDRAITTEQFFQSGNYGITLDLSYSSVYKLITPIGINAFSTSNSQLTNGQITSVTLIIEGDDVWNFPTNVYFDEESKPVFYPGTNILHLWKRYEDTTWKAHFTARGFGVSDVVSPGLKGSCCYLDSDKNKFCDDYVTANYCLERNGTFEALVPCNKNSCIVTEEKTTDGICCSEGRCLSDIDPNLCQTIGGYFISGITCGSQETEIPYEEQDNQNSLCVKKCKPQTVCCKDGQCLGNLTKLHCDLLDGKTVNANDCLTAKCCDHIEVNGACCIPGEDNTYDCVIVDTPYECNEERNGVFMGNNTTCNNNICCKIPIATCYNCVQDNIGCHCNPVSIYSGTCESNGYSFSSNEDCEANCTTKQCYKCTCAETVECQQISACSVCPDGYQEGNCETNCGSISKTCYANCVNANCNSQTVVLNSECDGNCETLAANGIVGSEYIYESCNCSDVNAACFWCFPYAEEIPSAISPILNTRYEWLKIATEYAQAPYRAVLMVNSAAINSLNSTEYVPPFEIESSNRGSKLITRDEDLLYFTEEWENSNSVDRINSALHQVFNLSELISDYHVLSHTGKFRCYYVGSYAPDLETSENNKQLCLNSFGYGNDENCKLCDPVQPLEYETPLGSGQTQTITRFEPYHNELNNLNYFAPFPPVWGRITYSRSWASCGTSSFEKATTNLRLMPISMIKDLCLKTKQGDLKSFMNNIISKYENNNSIVGEFNGGIREMLGSDTWNGNLHPSDIETNDYEYCLLNQYVKYDPYLRGTGNQEYPIWYGANWGVPDMKNCLECSQSSVKGGWYIPAFNSRITTDFTWPDIGDPIPNNFNDIFYPDRSGITLYGEVYYHKNIPEVLQIPRGIFGRNLRYNLSSFYSSTVFKDNNNDYVMKENEEYSIPISFRTGWSITTTPDNCRPAGTSVFCPSINCVSPDIAEQENCGPILGQNTGDNGDNTSYWGTSGLIVESILNTSSPIKVYTNEKSKSVKIEDGLCVNMLCPECYSYESC